MPMCEPSRFIALYRSVVEKCPGVTAHVAENESAVALTYDVIAYVLRSRPD